MLFKTMEYTNVYIYNLLTDNLKKSMNSSI